MTSVKKKVKTKTLLGWELTFVQDALVNYLIPSICACVLYMLILAADIAVIYRHYLDEATLWASLTILFIYLPVICSYLLLITDIDSWPHEQLHSRQNFLWIAIKTAEHLLFPVWRMWRYAERIFWSIEAVRGKSKESSNEAKMYVSTPRSIELYVFLQAYFHALPQVLLQLYILMRLERSANRQTINAQVLSMVLNLAKVAVTTTYYQRFKTQKLGGMHYPWFKRAKEPEKGLQIDGEVVLRRRPVTHHTSNLEDRYDIEPLRSVSERRASSDIYMEPAPSYSDVRKSFTHRIDSLFSRLPSSVISTRTFSSDQTDFNITRIRNVKALPEDDLAGKLIAFVWWYNFLLARILALAAFSYYYTIGETMYLVLVHVCIIWAFLLYDVKSNNIKRSKMVFFLFLGYVYMFCIIEFKVKFKKATFIYYGYFFLVYFENLIICLIWGNTEMDSLQGDFWLRFMYFAVVGSSFFSFSAMLFYFCVNKPEKFVVRQEPVETKF